ncbi:hypothetical protein [Absidia glauca]|uniref:Uncharacterized protein n=1 Tax=Absidia glauca TaxID=4829 RepID=A0A163JWH7_ABSGL|nr:hypothetical protein [Absidia glauca]
MKRLEAIHTSLFDDLVIVLGKMVQGLVKPGASFFDDFGSGFDGDVVRLDIDVDDGDDRSAPVEEFSFFLIFPPFDSPLSLQSLYGVTTSKPIILPCQSRLGFVCQARVDSNCRPSRQGESSVSSVEEEEMPFIV